MIKKIILIMLLVFIIPLVNALEDDEPDFLAVQYRAYDLKIPCQNADGSDCPSTTKCNLTVTYPDNTILVSNALTTNQATYHNYTFSQGRLNQNGEYNGKLVCNSNSSFGAASFRLLVSPSGARNILGLFIIVFVLAYTITFVGAYFNNAWLVILGGMALMGIGLYSVVNGIDIYKNLATQVISITTLGIGAYFSITAGIRIVEENL